MNGNCFRKSIDLVHGLLNEAVPLSHYRSYHAVKKDDVSVKAYGKLAAHADLIKKQRLYFDINQSDYPDVHPLEADGHIATVVFKHLDSYASDFTYFENILGLKRPFGKMLKSLQNPIHTDALFAEYRNGIFVDSNGRKYKIGKIINLSLNICKKMINQVDLDKTRLNLKELKNYHQTEVSADTFRELSLEIVQNTKVIFNKFMNDPIRSSTESASGNYKVVVSSHPYDITGMSTDRGWNSCTNVISGSEKHFIEAYIKSGALVAYMINSEDLNIKNPVSRCILMPAMYKDTTDESSKIVAYVRQDIYGFSSNTFRNKIEELLQILNQGCPDGLYQVAKGNQYPILYKKENGKFE